MNTPEETGAYQPADSPSASVDSGTPHYIGRYWVEKILGQGGFGLVYLAYDGQLQRLVAIKVPHSHRIASADDAQAYLTEARTVAGLDHPNIVPVHDVGSTEDYPCFIVSKFIEGSTLAEKIARDRPAFDESAELIATIAEALQYAHRKGLVHRDIKPGNILIDSSGKPFVVDFGLALREQDVGKKGLHYVGTPAYMSPEQARGEGHRVDGRSDVFSLGVCLYELLTGRRPFKGETQEELLEQIASLEVRPLRQYDDAIPKELERICLKALSKRAAERYTTAKDLEDDLRHFQRVERVEGGEWSVAGKERVTDHALRGSGASPSPLSSPTTHHTPPTTPSTTPFKIVPKGLRSFDAHDADFFLELVPGPRDRQGLPDSLRFWKTRIEEMDVDNTFAVGLIYGPSGCGKSSLVKAGLLPRLSENVIAVYVEATAGETETRLLNGLRKRCPALSADLGLRETVAALRRGLGIPGGKKVLIVLDQFEQWLHAKKEEQNTELVQALRQCDGGLVQCIVMVRDDFWMAVTRFLSGLEIELLQGRNCAAVDLFDSDHSRKVLAGFGRAFGKIPESSQQTGKEQKEFLHQAVSGLAQEGKVICVRLALFAEMMKGRPWTPAALKEVGGTAGVGVTFLDETFTAATANPKHRLHQKPAQAVLRALLPESGTDIKGHMRSYAELLEASGYKSRPKDFDDLIRILDSEIRLITPTDPEGVAGGGWRVEGEGVEGDGWRVVGENEIDSVNVPKVPSVPSTLHPPPSTRSRFYQLTHDYLVPALRDWLTRKQKETRRGRAGLLLADRAAVWNARSENRQLPSLLQWLQIRWWTAKKQWAPPQKKMMRKAGRYHAVRGLIVASILIFIGLASWEGYGRLQGQRLRDRLLEATTADVPGIVEDMTAYRRWVDPLLRDAKARAENEQDARKQLHISLALLPVDAGQVDYLYGRLLKAEPGQLAVLREALLGHKATLTERLWEVLENSQSDQDQRFRSAGALSAFAPDDSRWEKVCGDVAATLVVQKPFVLAQWTDAFKGVGRWLIPPLADFLVDEKRSISERGLIASVYGTFAAETPDGYARLEKRLAEPGEPNARLEAKIAFAKRQASIGSALMVMGKGQKVWPQLKHSPDPTVRSYLIDRLGPSGVDPKVLIARLDEEKEVSIRRAILLSLGEFGLDRLSLAERKNHLPHLLQLYRDEPDPGIHGAAEWLLRRWEASDRMTAIDRDLATGKVLGKLKWYLNRQGQTMVLVPKPGEFWMGMTEYGHGGGEQRHRRRIDRSFSIASKEVTVEQFLQFRKDHDYRKDMAPTNDCPVLQVSWYDAAAYCNWLSEKEGIPKEQWCYVFQQAALPALVGSTMGLLATPWGQGSLPAVSLVFPDRTDDVTRYGNSIKMAPDFLKRTGYRLPTEAEWEFACRAGNDTEYSFGDSADLLDRYAWISDNSHNISHPVGSMRSNDLGLFDMHGNAWEWCQDVYGNYPKAENNMAIPNYDEHTIIDQNAGRVLRGGSFNYGSSNARSADRLIALPAYRYYYFGFRVARTFIP